MTIMTKKGDKGFTSTLSKSALSKDSLIIETLGTLDELAAFLGLAKSLIKSKKQKNSAVEFFC